MIDNIRLRLPHKRLQTRGPTAGALADLRRFPVTIRRQRVRIELTTGAPGTMERHDYEEYTKGNRNRNSSESRRPRNPQGEPPRRVKGGCRIVRAHCLLKTARCGRRRLRYYNWRKSARNSLKQFITILRIRAGGEATCTALATRDSRLYARNKSVRHVACVTEPIPPLIGSLSSILSQQTNVTVSPFDARRAACAPRHECHILLGRADPGLKTMPNRERGPAREPGAGGLVRTGGG
ncbi:hypothetical protein EVAR_23566_1 [Eumeta japonica]|uniref:Uncharacterized protein n=1 Tax=Eumeta variegata TaxID=151549 RepID=A0A4C1X0D3_EUMVA|nr:hypothetical protein EVAR_23566_1 [Eumeta japonica]